MCLKTCQNKCVFNAFHRRFCHTSSIAYAEPKDSSNQWRSIPFVAIQMSDDRKQTREPRGRTLILTSPLLSSPAQANHGQLFGAIQLAFNHDYELNYTIIFNMTLRFSSISLTKCLFTVNVWRDFIVCTLQNNIYISQSKYGVHYISYE